MIACVVDYVSDPSKAEAFERSGAADRIGDESGCVLRYDRTSLRPVFR